MATIETVSNNADLASRLTTVLGLLPDFGDDLHAVSVNHNHTQEPTFRAHADVALSVYAGGQRCEDLAAEIFRRFPEARLNRHDGPFSIVQGGDPSWSVYFSDSVCTRVQTGTRTVTKPDPAAPLIEVEEPVYEWRCADPLADMAVSA